MLEAGRHMSTGRRQGGDELAIAYYRSGLDPFEWSAKSVVMLVASTPFRQCHHILWSMPAHSLACSKDYCDI